MASDQQSRTPNSFLVLTASAAVFVTVVILVIGSLAATRDSGDSVAAKRAAQRVEAHTKLDKAAMEKLSGVGWVDQGKGIVHVPIETAMAETVKSLSAKKAAPSQIKVEVPAPVPVADPNSKEPPPIALPSAPQGADVVHFPVPPATVPASAPTSAPSAPPVIPEPMQ